MKVSATLKGTPDSLGRRAVYIRVANGKTRTFKKINLKVAPADFSKGKIKATHPKHKEYNGIIKAEILDTEYGIIKPDDKVPAVSFFHFCTEFISKIENKRSSDTLRQYHSEIRKIKGYKESVILSKISADWLTGYSNYCYSLGNKENTVWKTFKFLKMIVRRALKEKKIIEDPFLFFEMPKYTDPQKTFLSREQVDKLDKYSQSNKCPDELKFITTWFVIACWTGLRYSDCRNFDKKQIKSGRLIIQTQKTNETVSFPFDDRLKKFFQRIDYRPLNITNEYCNRMLKVICDANDLDSLSFHASRHTFGTMASSSGIRQEVIAKLMGHRDMRMTAIYAKLTGKTMDAELSKMN
jgi:integrase